MRIDLTKALATVLLAVLTSICGLGVSSVQSLTASVNALNEKMAVVMTAVADYKAQLRDQDERIRSLELRAAGPGLGVPKANRLP